MTRTRTIGTFGGDWRPDRDDRIADWSSRPRTPTSWRICGPIRSYCSAASTSWRKAPSRVTNCPRRTGRSRAPQPIPGQAIVGGSFPRSFLIPGTEQRQIEKRWSIRSKP